MDVSSQSDPDQRHVGESVEDAIQQGLMRSAKTLRHVRGAWIQEQHAGCAEGRVTEYLVNMMVTFVLDDQPRPSVWSKD